MNLNLFIVAVLILTAAPSISVVFNDSGRPTGWMVVLLGIGFVMAVTLYVLNLLNGRQQINRRIR